MTETNVLALLCELMGESAEDNPSYASLAAEAVEEIKGRIRPGTTEYELNKYAKRLDFAAAATAFYKLTAIAALSSPTSVRAGEISLSNPTDIAAAERLLHSALSQISAVAQENDFCFMGVDMT